MQFNMEYATENLGTPVNHAIAVWIDEIQKLMHMEDTVDGAKQLLEETH